MKLTVLQKNRILELLNNSITEIIKNSDSNKSILESLRDNKPIDPMGLPLVVKRSISIIEVLLNTPNLLLKDIPLDEEQQQEAENLIKLRLQNSIENLEINSANLKKQESEIIRLQNEISILEKLVVKSKTFTDEDIERFKEQPPLATRELEKNGLRFTRAQLMSIAEVNGSFSSVLVEQYPDSITLDEKLRLASKHTVVASHLLENYQSLGVDPFKIHSIILSDHYEHFVHLISYDNGYKQFLLSIFNLIEQDPSKIKELNLHKKFYKNTEIVGLYLTTVKDTNIPSEFLKLFAPLSIKSAIAKDFSRLYLDKIFFKDPMEKISFSHKRSREDIFKLWSQVTNPMDLFSIDQKSRYEKSFDKKFTRAEKYHVPEIGQRTPLYIYFHYLIEFHKNALIDDSKLCNIFSAYIMNCKNLNEEPVIEECKDIIVPLIKYHGSLRAIIWKNFSNIQSTLLDPSLKKILFDNTAFEDLTKFEDLQAINQRILGKVMRRVTADVTPDSQTVKSTKQEKLKFEEFSVDQESKIGVDAYQAVKQELGIIDPVMLFKLIDANFLFLISDKDNENYKAYLSLITANSSNDFFSLFKKTPGEILKCRSIGVVQIMLIESLIEYTSANKVTYKQLQSLIDSSLVLNYKRGNFQTNYLSKAKELLKTCQDDYAVDLAKKH